MDTESKRGKGFRFGIRTLLVVFTILGIACASYAWVHRKFIEPRQYADAVEARIESLVTRRPKKILPRQWESAVAWTLNLHGNSLMMFQADGPTIRSFDHRLADKLADDVDIDTIHWIWDEYAAICNGGKKYEQRYRKVMLEEIENGGHNWSLNVP